MGAGRADGTMSPLGVRPALCGRDQNRAPRVLDAQISPDSVRPLRARSLIAWSAMLKSFAVWVCLGFALGLKVYLDHAESAGGEAVVFLAMGLMFGATGGLIFNILYRVQLRHGYPTNLQAVLTGLSAASVFVGINALQAAIDPTVGSKGNSDLVATAVVLAASGMAGLLAGILLKATGPAVQASTDSSGTK